MNKSMLLAFALTGIWCNGNAQTQPSQAVDLNQFSGKWYIIASYPSATQKTGCHCTTSDYEIETGKEYIRIMNRCIVFHKDKSRVYTRVYKAFLLENSSNSRLKIRISPARTIDYIILETAGDYSWAIAGHPKKEYLWILSREAYMPGYLYSDLIDLANTLGYDIKKLIKTPQNCDILN